MDLLPMPKLLRPTQWEKPSLHIALIAEREIIHFKAIVGLIFLPFFTFSNNPNVIAP
jgi:hypothetical protein